MKPTTVKRGQPWMNSAVPPRSWAAWILTRSSMWRPWSMGRIGSSEAGACPVTRQGYRQLLAWMQTFGELQRVGMESTGTYGAGLFRHLRKAGVEVLEVTGPDRHDRRRRGSRRQPWRRWRRESAGDGRFRCRGGGPCCLRRSAHCNAEDQGRNDRGFAGAQGLPQRGALRHWSEHGAERPCRPGGSHCR